MLLRSLRSLPVNLSACPAVILGVSSPRSSCFLAARALATLSAAQQQQRLAQQAAERDVLGSVQDRRRAAGLSLPWRERYSEVKAYHAEHGHCNVPQGWATNPQLGNWVMRQRAAKKRLDRGDRTRVLTEEQVVVLEALGFEWKLRASLWERRYAELKAYHAEHGHCNVPRSWTANQQLRNLVATQRKRKKRLDRGDRTGVLTEEQVVALEALGFEWKLRASSSER